MQNSTHTHPMATRTRVTPTVDIIDRHDDYLIVLDLPGAPESGIDVTIDHDQLTVRAPIEIELPDALFEIHREFSAGEYFRKFTVGSDIDREQITASYRDGVLELRLPKAQKDRIRKVEIKTYPTTATTTTTAPPATTLKPDAVE